ncbi:MAG: RagB/SusD family nutrient uptake outer membrane protein, partial [Heyndrickxia sp.]
NTAITEYTTPLRLAEQHLIRAEARAMINKLPQAVEDVDAIRFRSGLPLIKDTNPSISKEDLLKVIFHERQVELFVEWGHRWIDLKRSGKIDAVMSVVSPTKGGTWSNYKSLWPIPIKDIQNNPNLVQNDGYK